MIKVNTFFALVLFLSSISLYSQIKEPNDLMQFSEKCDSLVRINDKTTLRNHVRGFIKSLDNTRPDFLESLSTANYYLLSISLRNYEIDSAYKYGLLVEDYVNNNSANNLITTRIHEALGQLYYYKNDLSKCEDYFQKLIGSTESYWGSGHIETLRPYNSLGILYTALGKYSQAIENLEKGLQIVENSEENQGSFKMKLMANLANIYHNVGLYYESLEINKKLLEEEQLSNNQGLGIAELQNNIGIAYTDLDDFENAKLFFEKALEGYLNHYGPDNIQVATTKTNLSYVLQELNEYDKAQRIALESINTIKAQSGANHFFIANTYNILAANEFAQSNFSESMNYGLKAIDIYENQELLGQFEYSDCLLNLYKTSTALEDDTSENKFSAALNNALNYFEDSPLEEGKINHPVILLEYLMIKSDYLLRRNKNNIAIQTQRHLDKYYLDIIELIDYVESVSTNKKTREYHFNQVYDAYGKVLSYWSSQDNFEQTKNAILASEKSKAKFLRESLLFKQIKSSSLIGDSLLVVETSIDKEIQDLNREIFLTEKNTPQDSTSYLKLKNDLTELHVRKDNHSRLIRNEFPKYYQIRNELPTISIQEMQNRLSGDESLLEYFVGNDYLFSYIINKDSIYSHKSVMNDSLAQMINLMREGIYKNHYNGEVRKPPGKIAISDYHKYAHKLYALLVEPVRDNLKHNIILIPDGPIYLLPFDALITNGINNNAQNSPTYLIEQHTISYAYSINSYYSKKTSNQDFTYDIGIFSPEYGSENRNSDNNVALLRSNLGPLYFNEEEGQGISALYKNSQLFTKDEASKSKFLEEPSKYRMLHLATHAKSDLEWGEASFIAFSDNLQSENVLYNSELYPMELNPELVVLSACETGLGNYERGNGVISLNNGFLVAGAKSVISSLWSVNDAFSKDFMFDLYNSLKDGSSKEKALRETKLKFLNHPVYSDPFYWSTYILSGQRGKVEAGGLGLDFRIVILLSGIIGLIVFLKLKNYL